MRLRVTDRQTARQTDPTTVILAAHARRGLMTHTTTTVTPAAHARRGLITCRNKVDLGIVVRCCNCQFQAKQSCTDMLEYLSKVHLAECTVVS